MVQGTLWFGAPEPSEPSSLGFVALATNPANPAKTAFNVLMNPAKLGKLGF